MATNEAILKVLPNEAVRSALLEIIENNIPSKNYTLSIEMGSAKGDNYIGIVHRVSALYKDDDQDDTSEPKKLGVFIKVPPDNLVRRQQFFARPCFLRESLMYDEYLPLLVEFQESKGIIPEENGFKEVASCYKNLTNDLEEAVFMEDLSLKGFVMHSRFESASFDLVKVVIKALAKLHALSFALKDQWPERFAKFTEIDEVFIKRRESDQLVKYMNCLNDIAYNALSNKGDEEYLERVKALLTKEDIFDLMTKLVTGSTAGNYAVLCHGDCWNNNILFKYENGKPVDARLIDWQIARFASPVCDLMYFLVTSTTKPLRDEHFMDIIDEYHSELASFLRRLGSDPEVLFPRSALDDQLKKFSAFGMIMGLMILPTITTKAEDAPDLDEVSARLESGDTEMAKEAVDNAKKCSSRIRDVIVDLIELGAI